RLRLRRGRRRRRRPRGAPRRVPSRSRLHRREVLPRFRTRHRAELRNDMTDLTRARMDEFWATWLAANREAESRRDWSILAAHFDEDPTYGWMYTTDEHFMAVGRDEIAKYALGTEMAGLDGWHYDYVATVMDESNGMVVGF